MLVMQLVITKGIQRAKEQNTCTNNCTVLINCSVGPNGLITNLSFVKTDYFSPNYSCANFFSFFTELFEKFF